MTLDVSRQITVLQCVTRCSLVVRYQWLARPCCHYIYTLNIEVPTSHENSAPLPNHTVLQKYEINKIIAYAVSQ